MLLLALFVKVPTMYVPQLFVYTKDPQSFSRLADPQYSADMVCFRISLLVTSYNKNVL